MAHSRKARRIICTKKIGEAEVALTDYLRNKSHSEKQGAERGKDCGAWLTAMPLRLNRTVLTVEQLRLSYGLCPEYMPAKCYGCGATFTVRACTWL